MSRILTTKDSLLNYAAWYAMRYFPSFRKLREALMKKSLNNEDLVASVMKEMTAYISEERTVDGLVRMYTEQSKTRPYIEQKLRLKKFGEDIITATLKSYHNSFISWTSYEQAITRKMNDYLEKNKSKTYIIGTLSQKYPNFKNEIRTLLNDVAPDETETIQAELTKLSEKYDIRHQKERQKVVQKLCLKGFSYNRVREIINKKDLS
ncbi:TPA: hypothetical protein DCZ36_02650 [Candidatus Gracilibacteria bacterium]|nr:hypothetical protein [Candidatus Gracilibacteria bacterium]